jgi:hypothetical protein
MAFEDDVRAMIVKAQAEQAEEQAADRRFSDWWSSFSREAWSALKEAERAVRSCHIPASAAPEDEEGNKYSLTFGHKHRRLDIAADLKRRKVVVTLPGESPPPFGENQMSRPVLEELVKVFVYEGLRPEPRD